MGKRLHYIFFGLGVLLLLSPIYTFVKAIITHWNRYKDPNAYVEMELSALEIIFFSMAYGFESIAIALFCFLAARICKLEQDPSFKDDITKLVRRIRSAGQKN